MLGPRPVAARFSIGEESDWTFRTFYEHFANALGLSLDAIPIAQPGKATEHLDSHPATVNQWWNPVSWARGTKTILKSWEFRAFGHLILQTDPFGAAPRWAFEHVPVLGRAKQKLVGADADAPLPIYRPTDSTGAKDWYEMGSAGARVSIEKARRLLGYHPPITADGGLELTLAWVRHARLLG